MKHKICLPAITLNKKHSSKQVVPITYTPGKSFFANAIFLKFVSGFFSDRVRKVSVHFVR